MSRYTWDGHGPGEEGEIHEKKTGRNPSLTHTPGFPFTNNISEAGRSSKAHFEANWQTSALQTQGSVRRGHDPGCSNGQVPSTGNTVRLECSAEGTQLRGAGLGISF